MRKSSVGCDDDEDVAASTAVGTSTIQGNVKSFVSGGVTVSFSRVRMQRGVLSSIADLLVPVAQAAVEGVTIQDGEDLGTVNVDVSQVAAVYDAGPPALFSPVGTPTVTVTYTAP